VERWLALAGLVAVAGALVVYSARGNRRVPKNP
jgi:hypothetical protein